jgi:hypothetical protein
MIAEPGIATQLRAISRDLRAIVEPALADRGAVVIVQMMAALLDALATRSAGEVSWMRSESEAILDFATRLAAAHPTANALCDALERAASAGGDLSARYADASECLSCAAEAALHEGTPGEQAEVWRLLLQRLEHEIAIIGESFQPLGRA